LSPEECYLTSLAVKKWEPPQPAPTPGRTSYFSSYWEAKQTPAPIKSAAKVAPPAPAPAPTKAKFVPPPRQPEPEPEPEPVWEEQQAPQQEWEEQGYEQEYPQETYQEQAVSVTFEHL
jgi:hypothetical protein